MLIWVASFPRSGNTLTLQTLHDVYGINRFCAIGEDDLWMRGRHRGAGYEVPDELQGLSKSELLEALRERPEPFFCKTHRLDDSADPAPAVYVVRDGRDVQVSRAHWVGARGDGPGALPFPERLRKLARKPNWSNHVHAWRTREAPTALLRFEDLVEDAAGTVKRACDELGVPLPEPVGELTPFSELQKRSPVMHRRGKSGSWREEMPAPVEELFWKVHREEMEAIGYSADGRASRDAGKAGASKT